MGLVLAADAAEVAFAHLGVAATYTPAGGSPVAVTAFPSISDPTRDLGEISMRAPGHVVLLRQAEVPTKPPAGSTVIVGSETYTIRTVEHGPQDTVWICGTA